MSDWWDVSSGWAGWFQVVGRHRLAGRRRLAGHRDRPLLGPPRPVHRRHRQPRLQLPGGTLSSGWLGVVPHRHAGLPARVDRQRRLPLHRPPRPVHHRLGRPHHVDVVGRATGWAALVPGHRAGSRRTARPSRRSRATRSTSTCSPSAPTTASTAAGGTTAPAGPAGSRCRRSLPARLHGDRRRALPRPARPVHDRLRRPDHVDLVERPRRLGHAGSRSPAAWPRRARRSPPSPGTPTTSTCSSSAPTTGSTAPGGTTPRAGPAGSTCPAGSASRAARSRRSSRVTEHIDVFIVGSDGLDLQHLVGRDRRLGRLVPARRDVEIINC